MIEEASTMWTILVCFPTHFGPVSDVGRRLSTSSLAVMHSGRVSPRFTRKWLTLTFRDCLSLGIEKEPAPLSSTFTCAT